MGGTRVLWPLLMKPNEFMSWEDREKSEKIWMDRVPILSALNWVYVPCMLTKNKGHHSSLFNKIFIYNKIGYK